MGKERKITVIDANPKASDFPFRDRMVAVYARVSTLSDEQINSIEAQKDYYFKYIQNHRNWIFFKLYTDTGISGNTYKHRAGFNQMIQDALTKKFDLIITKSISRFARNTVDSIVHIRKLKEIGCEVYFEKENLWTLDSKSEFFLTLLSSIAQEESRSISENVTWGKRKYFADGKYHVPFSNFLGYDRGKNGEMVVNPTQALIVRQIFKLYLCGYTSYKIADYLTDLNLLPPNRKDHKWRSSTIDSILRNEKYKGDALTQKKFTVDFLSKKCKKNEGELPKYYIEGGHELIIPRATFDYVQSLLKNRARRYGNHYSCSHPLATKIYCLTCNRYFGLHGSHSKKYKSFDWYCANKYKKRSNCSSPRIAAEVMKDLCIRAFIQLLSQRKHIFKFVINQIDNLNIPNNRKSKIVNYCRNSLYANLVIPDEVMTVTIDTIIPNSNGKISFLFINNVLIIIPYKKKRKIKKRHEICDEISIDSSDTE